MSPDSIGITAGQPHESKGFEPAVNAVRIPQPSGRPRTRPSKIAGDKAYPGAPGPQIRRWLRDHHIAAVIPAWQLHYPRRGRPPQLARAAYTRRNVIERCIGWLKQARRIATRYEKTAVNFLAMLKLAMIQRYFRIQLRDTT